jgi:two-component system phosphate regulon sensor histidine kinase PhoR
VDQDASPRSRPRSNTWGAPSDREALLVIAEDVRARTGFAVCAIEVLRADGMLEFVAIAGSAATGRALLGTASPLAAMTPALRLGAIYGDFTFVATEWLTSHAKALLAEYGHIPDLPDSSDVHRWRAEDMLVASIRDDRGDLRGFLYLDEPLDGLRRTDRQLSELTSDLALPLRALLTAFEREELAHRARLLSAAGEAVRRLSSRGGVSAFLDAARPYLTAGLRADELVFRLDNQTISENIGDLPQSLLAVIDRSARRCWEWGAVLIVESQEVWGDPSLSLADATALSAHVAARANRPMIVLPIGAADEFVGAVLFTRGSSRWTGGESVAATDMGQDLGRAVQLAHALDREQELIEELRRVDRLRNEFARTVSHELKNPLTLLSSYVEVLQDGPHLQSQETALDAIARGTLRLERLLNDLGTLSSVVQEAGAPLVPVNLNSTVRDAVELNLAAATRRGIALTSEVPKAATVVSGDAQALLDALHNLVSNAVKYSDAGGVVHLSLSRDGEQVSLQCRDEGLGISEADQRKLFTDFFRSTNVEALRRPGTGLGLPIVRRTVERLGGQIDVSSRLGVGTTFTVTFPAMATA